MSTMAGGAIGGDELLQRASALVPVLAERALVTEHQRRVPDETIKDLMGAGLLRIANPARYGGYGLDYDTVIEVGAVLGRGCGSTAWCFTVWSSHNCSLFDASPIQRAHRDVHAGSHQVALMWDTYAEQYGRVRLGLEPTDIFV